MNTQGIVIQGPTNYYKEIVECYKNIPNVVWSTWDDEPSENIEYIGKYIPVILNKKPLFPGYLNVNMQTVSTMGGISYLKEKGINEILKVRGDIIITNITKFLSILKGKDMAFLAIAKEGARKDINVVFPANALKKLHEEGILGSVAENFFTCMGGIYSHRAVEKELAPNLVSRCLHEKIDVVLLVPV